MALIDERLDAMNGSAMTISAFDGFIAGLAVCPEPVEPDEWLPWVWGEEEAEANIFTDSDDRHGLVDLLTRHFHTVRFELGQGQYAPVYEFGDDPDPIWELWINGFHQALALRPDSWMSFLESPDEEAATAMAAMLALIAIDQGETDDLESDGVDVEGLSQEAPDLIPMFVDALHAEWARLHRKAAGPVTRQKVGRNDPCPCGSSKKYKKCCGAAAP
jgi:uncharacterized protein